MCLYRKVDTKKAKIYLELDSFDIQMQLQLFGW